MKYIGHYDRPSPTHEPNSRWLFPIINVYMDNDGNLYDWIYKSALKEPPRYIKDHKAQLTTIQWYYNKLFDDILKEL